jgi:hypothetical protein
MVVIGQLDNDGWSYGPFTTLLKLSTSPMLMPRIMLIFQENVAFFTPGRLKNPVFPIEYLRT